MTVLAMGSRFSLLLLLAALSLFLLQVERTPVARPEAWIRTALWTSSSGTSRHVPKFIELEEVRWRADHSGGTSLAR
eukprot:15037262-Alexandrium_andersonii.AAC.1